MRLLGKSSRKPKQASPMKILQGNLRSSRTADVLLEQLRLEADAELLIISEQYNKREEAGWYADSIGTAAICITDPIVPSPSSHGAGSRFVSVRCGNFSCVMRYLTPNVTIHDFREKVDTLEDIMW